jgi:hypothetical protein
MADGIGHMLEKRSSQKHVQELQTPTDGQDRQVDLESGG